MTGFNKIVLKGSFFVLIFHLFGLAAFSQSDSTAADREWMQKGIQGFPVLGVMDDTVFYVYIKMGASAPSERAGHTTEKTRRLYEDDDFSVDSFRTSLGDFYISYQINAHSRGSLGMARVYSELHHNIQDVFFERGIEIMSPHYRAARDGNMAAIPANYLPQDYQVPAFNVKMDQKKRHLNPLLSVSNSG